MFQVKKILLKAISLALAVSILSAGMLSYAVVEEEANGADMAETVEQTVEYLSVYARYDEISQAKLYKETLLKLIEENPELYEEALKVMLSSIDDYSEYFNAGEYQQYAEQAIGEFVGIGINYQMGIEGIEVLSVIDDTPAQRAGLQVGDVIVSVDGVPTVGLNTNQARALIVGEIGTLLQVEVKRQNVGTLYINIQRDLVKGNSVSSTIIEKDGIKVMYIRINSFISKTAEEFNRELDVADGEGIKNIIIDLRDNGGGILQAAIAIAERILPEGCVIVKEDHKMDLLDGEAVSHNKNPKDYNIVVLINENSASASEVLTAALSENNKAFIIGERSFGKGTIQSFAELPYGDSIKYTMAYYLTPNGNNLNKVGITPDQTVENEIVPFDMSPYKKFESVCVYKLGDSSEEIANAKAMLKVWGVYNGEINDCFDEEMENAVYKFQSATGLFPYGELDLTTQHELYTRLEMSKSEIDRQLDSALEYFGITTEE